MQIKVDQPRRSGRPTESEAERLNAEIVQAALNVFVRVGFSGASIEQVVVECGATRRSVAHRFRDKQALLLAVLDRKSQGFLATVIDPDIELTDRPLEVLRRTCKSIYEGVMTSETAELYRLCIAEATRLPEVSARFITFNDRLASDLEVLVRRAQGEGAFEDLQSSAVVTSLIGTFISNPLNRLTLGDKNFMSPRFQALYFQEMWSFNIGRGCTNAAGSFSEGSGVMAAGS